MCLVNISFCVKMLRAKKAKVQKFYKVVTLTDVGLYSPRFSIYRYEPGCNKPLTKGPELKAFAYHEEPVMGYVLHVCRNLKAAKRMASIADNRKIIPVYVYTKDIYAANSTHVAVKQLFINLVDYEKALNDCPN